MRRRILLIGQAPSRTSKKPFDGKSGRNLSKLMGVDQKHLTRYFRLVNVLDYWPGKSGKGDAFPKGQIPDKLRRTVAAYPAVLFAGWGVAKRFKFTCQSYLTWCPYDDGKRVAAVLPHPSGVNRWYNDPTCRKEAEMFLHGIVWLADLERKHGIK